MDEQEVTIPKINLSEKHLLYIILTLVLCSLIVSLSLAYSFDVLAKSYNDNCVLSSNKPNYYRPSDELKDTLDSFNTEFVEVK